RGDAAAACKQSIDVPGNQAAVGDSDGVLRRLQYDADTGVNIEVVAGQGNRVFGDEELVHGFILHGLQTDDTPAFAAVGAGSDVGQEAVFEAGTVPLEEVEQGFHLSVSDDLGLAHASGIGRVHVGYSHLVAVRLLGEDDAVPGNVELAVLAGLLDELPEPGEIERAGLEEILEAVMNAVR